MVVMMATSVAPRRGRRLQIPAPGAPGDRGRGPDRGQGGVGERLGLLLRPSELPAQPLEHRTHQLAVR